MACATLKRTQPFGVIDSAPVKRRRFTACSPVCNTNLRLEDSPFVPNEPTTQTQLKRRIKEEIKRLQRRRLIPKFFGVPDPTAQNSFGGPLREDNSAITSCSGILRSMALQSPQRDSQDSDVERSPDRPIEAAIPGAQGPKVSDCSAPVASRPVRNFDTVPIFTLPQVTSLCDRLIKEREDELRLEYDNILSCKLAEQYEAFLKFSHDQLYSRFQNSPMSYVS